MAARSAVGRDSGGGGAHGPLTAVAPIASVSPSPKPKRRTSAVRATPLRSEHRGADVLHEGPHIVRPPTLVGLNEVGVLLRDVRRPEAEALETGLLDQAPGRVAGRIGEDRSGVGAPGLMRAPPADNGRDLRPFRLGDPLA